MLYQRILVGTFLDARASDSITYPMTKELEEYIVSDTVRKQEGFQIKVSEYPLV